MTTTAKTTTDTVSDGQAQYAHAAQAMAKLFAAAQERNVQYTRTIFESTIALLKSHMEDTRSLMEQWRQQGDARTSGTYMNFFSAPFAAYQQMLEGVETATKQSLESLEQANHAKATSARK